MDTSIAIAIALGVLFLVILPGYLTRLEVTRSRQELDQLPETVRPIEVSERAARHAQRSTLPLMAGSAPAAATLPSPRWPMALGGVESIAAERERPQLRVVGGEEQAQEAAEVQYLDLASGEMYPATHISALPKERLMNQERPPRAAASASRRPSNTRRPLAHVSGRAAGGSRGSAGGTARTVTQASAGKAPRPASAPGQPAPRQQGPRPQGAAPRPEATRPARYPALGLLFLVFAAAAVVSAVLLVMGLVPWALPVLAAGLALGDLALIGALRRAGTRAQGSAGQAPVARREQPAGSRAGAASGSQARGGRQAGAVQSDAGAKGAAKNGARKSTVGASGAGASRASDASSDRPAVERPRMATTTRAAHPAATVSEPARDAQEHVTDEIPALAAEAAPGEQQAADQSPTDHESAEQKPAEASQDAGVTSAARRIATVRSRSWTPTPLPQPTYAAPERGGADVSLQEALAMEFASEPGRRPEIDDAMAHGRNATRPGKGDPAGMAELAREKREAEEAPVKNSMSSIDDILQRRRA